MEQNYQMLLFIVKLIALDLSNSHWMKETSLHHPLLWYFKTDLYETLFPLKSSRFALFTNRYNEENLGIWLVKNCPQQEHFIVKPWLNSLGEFRWWSRWENSETAHARLDSTVILNDYYILYALSVFNVKREISYIQVPCNVLFIV